MLQYKKALPSDAEILSDIAKKSKQNWGYPNEWMQLWQEDLTLTQDYVSENHVFKIYDANQLIGFYALIDAQIPEVDHFWLTAQNQRKGYGSKIFEHIRETVSKLGKPVFQLVAEPHAKGFYDKMQGVVLSKFESKIPGRFLEVYRFAVFPEKL